MNKAKVLSIFILLSNLAYGAVWSSMTSSGIDLQYMTLNQFIKAQNKKIQEFWEKDIADLISKIANEQKTEEEIYKKIEQIEKEILLIQKEKSFLLKQEIQLLDNYQNIKGVIND